MGWNKFSKSWISSVFSRDRFAHTSHRQEHPQNKKIPENKKNIGDLFDKLEFNKTMPKMINAV